MKNEDKIQELENRVHELEKQIEGATIYLSALAPLFGLFGRSVIEDGKIDDGSEMVVFANKLKNPENCPLLFAGIAENREKIQAWGKLLELQTKAILG